MSGVYATKVRGYIAMSALGLSILLLLAAQGPDDNAPLGQSANSYCGIQAVYRAALAINRPVSYEALIQKKYLGSSQGSSLGELDAAARDHGLHSLPLYNARLSLLYMIDSPTILHCKANETSRDFDHWVLFLGVHDNSARIGDRFEKVINVGMDELASRWDGNGLVISDKKISVVLIYIKSLSTSLLYFAIAAFAAVSLHQVTKLYRSLQVPARPAVAILCVGLVDAALLLFLAVIIGVGYALVAPDGYLTCKPCVAGIQQNYLFESFDTVTANQVQQLRLEGAVLIDARQSFDYNRGHMKGAINVPPNSLLAECARLIAGVGDSKTLVVYCQNGQCPYSKMVANKLANLGFRRIKIYNEGWENWVQFCRAQNMLPVEA